MSGVGFNLNRTDARVRITALNADYDAIMNGTASLSDAQIDSLLTFTVGEGKF